MRSQLREELEPLSEINFALTAASSIGGWSGQRGDLERLASSYADGYRVQIHRLAGHTAEPLDVERLRLDLALLMRSGRKDGRTKLLTHGIS